MNAKQQEKQEALAELRTMLKPGDTVHTILRHVSRSGMMRVIDPVVIRDDTPRSIAHLVAKVLGDPLDRDQWGVKQTGCGMDMGFNLVYNLSYRLFPDGHGCIGEGCPSNDHSNDFLGINPNRVISTGEDNITGVLDPYDARRKHTDGGYALRHKWL